MQGVDIVEAAIPQITLDLSSHFSSIFNSGSPIMWHVCGRQSAAGYKHLPEAGEGSLPVRPKLHNIGGKDLIELAYGDQCRCIYVTQVEFYPDLPNRCFVTGRRLG